MPAQIQSPKTVFYSENDTWPPLGAILIDGDKEPIDLTGASVTISIAYSRHSYYYSPTAKIVSNAPCDVVDVLGGGIEWTPTVGDLTPPGTFLYTFEITHSSGAVQTVPANTYQPLIIRTGVGGQIEGPP
jgi:hypothetical protein